MINKIKGIYQIISNKGWVVIFKEEPKEGDSITVGYMHAVFHFIKVNTVPFNFEPKEIKKFYER